LNPGTRAWINRTALAALRKAIDSARPAVEWEERKPHQLEAALYVIAVDEFAEVELPGLVYRQSMIDGSPDEYSVFLIRPISSLRIPSSLS
jgi:hypothetical protein